MSKQKPPDLLEQLKAFVAEVEALRERARLLEMDNVRLRDEAAGYKAGCDAWLEKYHELQAQIREAADAAASAE
jgi:hypothetical protein